MAQPLDLSIATRPGNSGAVPGLVEDINALSSSLREGDEETRHKLISKTRNLLQSLQTPREQMVQHTWADPGLDAALITGVDTGLWKLMVKNGAEKPQKVEDLAAPLGMDPVLLGRLLRHVCAMGHLEEVGHDEYKLTSFTKSMSLDVIGDGYLALLGGIGRSHIEFYKFLRETNWRNPVDAAHTSMHASYNTDQPNCFEYLRTIGLGPQTNHHMGGYRQGRVPWMHPSLYPVEKILFPDADTSADAPLVVDVAGGLGHDIDEFKKMYPNHPGKLVLQDLPVVISDVKNIDPSIELMSHDFLTPQPASCRGAKAYFMHSIMHDWPDDVCRNILGHIADAMKPGYSKLLIFEVVIPQTGAYWEATAGDILMMTQLSAVERTESHWHELIEKSGLKLKIVKFWKCGQSDVENLIECELVE